ncbi:Predicted FMN-binding regulatory protein PaiB (PaiB) (PDB:2OL5) [Commensalibacter communis]|uniref:FMN-binding negative transcriptional regulator n=1 Tax=Commensalibacter communis TaxID=2972786 RepID=UPI0022FF55D0|nr:FMN-binding negative transcriptional regulator [Commensalibacter communis]CAI3936425.1 Predicted FMN-binding regulatory protein PaiB (PaiB) (PDB:2OL5) [Commensalibacter communis]
MYIPEHFKENDLQLLHTAIKEIQIAHIVTQHSYGVEASFIPLYLDTYQNEKGILYGHIAKANTQWNEPLISPEALAIFTGANHYITPSWYPAKQTHHKVVPTWNYVMVHVRGKIEFIQDPQELLSIVTKITDINEKQFNEPWHVQDAPSDYIQSILKAIIGIKISIADIKGKYKLSQNYNENTQQSIINGLQETKDNDGIKVAELMQDHLSKHK